MKTKANPLEEAELQLARAQHHLNDLRARVESGDDRITSADLAAADADLEFAGLRLDAARRLHLTADQTAHRQRCAALLDELRDGPVADEAETLTRAYQLAVAVLTDLHAAARSYQAMADTRVQELTQLAPIPVDLGSVHGGIGPMVRDDAGCLWTTQHANAEALLVAAVAQAITADMGPDFIGIYGERLKAIAGLNRPADIQLWEELSAAHPGRTFPHKKVTT